MFRIFASGDVFIVVVVGALAFALGFWGFWECSFTFIPDPADAAKKIPSRAVFTYHRSWSYFADAFGFEVVNTVEPVPGIPPTARHLQELVDQAKARKVGVLIEEPYFSSDGGKFLNRQAGVRPVVQAASCDAPTAGSYLAHFDAVMAAIAGGQ